MKNICILLTDDKGINEEILINSLHKIKTSKINKVYLIGDQKLFKKIFLKIKNIKKIIFLNVDLINYNYFNYLLKITNLAIKLFKKNKIKFLINMPFNKKKFLKKKYNGYTELFSRLYDKKKNENMLLYNENFSVCPLTTHVQIKKVNNLINRKKLNETILNISNFYKKTIKKKIKIIVLGLEPHASKDLDITTKDKTVINDTVKKFKSNSSIIGPIPADTAFADVNNKVFIGMYHDQVLVPFKMKNKFNGINITLGKKLLRISPDHGPGIDLINKKKLINKSSFISCIKFCEKY